MRSENRLLLARLLTRSGDHAWDFAVPLALLQAFPGQLQVAAIYYLVTKLLTIAVTPASGRWMDRHPRSTVLRFGVGFQFVGVVVGALVFWRLDAGALRAAGEWWHGATLWWFVILILIGAVSSMAATMTDISVGNDLVPSIVPPAELTRFNSLLRRVDLGTEMVSPIIAGLLFSLQLSGFHLFGFLLIVLWNVLSFFPEYFLLLGVSKVAKESSPAEGILQAASVTATPDAEATPAATAATVRTTFLPRGPAMIRSLRSEPLLPLLLSYSLLWLSALSPHGVLLTGYLKDEAHLSEVEIGVFRGLGAVFGLLSTVTFPYLVQRVGLLKSSSAHLAFQAAVLGAAGILFSLSASFPVYGFLLLVLFSRIGLYGFSNGEFELRQRLIAAAERGRVNSLGSFLNTLATLILFGLGSILPSTKDFGILIYVSSFMVVAGFVVFELWRRRIDLASLKNTLAK